MDEVAAALPPVFVASFALQQLLELLDAVLDAVIKRHKWILSAVAFVVSLVMSLGLNLRILAPLGFSNTRWIDVLITALLITGGSKGINDLIKVLAYKKAEVKAWLSEAQAAEV